MLRRIAIGQIKRNVWIFFVELQKQFIKKARSERGKDAGPHMSVLRSADRGDFSRSMFNMFKCGTGATKEAFSGQCQGHTAGMPLKQGCAKFVFKVAHAPADARFKDMKGVCRFSKTAVLSRGYEIGKMTKLNCHVHQFVLSDTMRSSMSGHGFGCPVSLLD